MLALEPLEPCVSIRAFVLCVSIRAIRAFMLALEPSRGLPVLALEPLELGVSIRAIRALVLALELLEP